MPAYVGYYYMPWGEGNPNQVAPIVNAGQTPVKLFDLTAADLAGIDVLEVENGDNSGYDAEYLSRLSSVADFVASGKTLIIHDRFVDQAESILPGGAAFDIVRNFDDPNNINVVPPGNTVLINGPAGTLNNDSLDGGGNSSHGYAVASSLPATATLLLSNGTPDHIVDFAYRYGRGYVVYSTIPLDFQLPFGSPFSGVYAVNMIAYGVDLLNVAPVAHDSSATLDEDTSVTGTLSASDADGDALTFSVGTGPSHGTVTFLDASAGTYRYTPNPNYFGTDSFTFSADDGRDASATATVSITINGVNDAPVAGTDSYSVDEDSTLTASAPGVLANDSDVDGDALTAILVTGPTHGGLVLNPDGSFSYTPVANYNGTDSFTYTANDGSLDSNTATVTITVLPVDDAPVANSQSVSTAEDTAKPITLTATDIDGDSLSYVIVTGPSHGSLSGTAPNLTYTPAADYNGSDSFTFKASDGSLSSNEATISITVTPVNDPPTVNAGPDISVAEGATFTVTAAGADVDGDALSYSWDFGDGTPLVSGQSATHTYPDDGVFSVAVTVDDGHGAQATDYLVVTVNNVPPQNVSAGADQSGVEGTAATFTGSFTDPGALDTHTLAWEARDPDGNVVATGDDTSFTFTPADNGVYSVLFTVTDNAGASSWATALLTVSNAAPQDLDAGPDRTVSVGHAASFTGSFSDPGTADTHTLTWTASAAGATLAQGEGAAFTFTPTAAEVVTVTFTVTDDDGGSASVSVTVICINDPPVAADDSYSTDEDTPLIVTAPGVLANDTDNNGDTLTAVLVSGPSHGSLTLNANGSFSYTPVANYHGQDSFSYRANDGSADSGVATVSITVNSVNDAPAAGGDSYSVDEDSALTVPALGVLANDSDVDGDTLTALLVAGPAHGNLVLNPDGSFSYSPAANYNGTDSFSYKASDGVLDSSVATVYITVSAVNDAPVAADDSYSVNEDTTLNVAAPGVLGNDSDIDSPSLTAVLVNGPSHGTLTLNASGSFSYTPAANYNGPDSFTYQANDGSADSGVATVYITVSAVNDAPVAVDDSYSTSEDTTLTVPAPGVLGNDTDADSPSLTAILVTGPAHGTLTLNANGSFSYTPAANYNGPDSFTYKASDGSLDSNVATVSITVNAVNDAPVAADDSYSVNEDTTLNVTALGVLGNDSDIDSASLTAVLVSGPSHGSLTLNLNGSFSYTPSANYNGPDSFTYKANDGSADSGVATVSITVNSVNDAPVAAANSFNVDEDSTLTVSAPGVLGNDSDVDGDTLTAVLDTTVSHGTLALNSNGSFTYTPNANFNGPDSFTYHATDGTAGSNLVTVSIFVNPVNDAPAAADDVGSVTEDTSLTAAGNVLANDSDVDNVFPAPANAGLTVASADTGVRDGTYGSLTLNSDGSFTYTLDNEAVQFLAQGQTVTDAFSYQATDGAANSSPATLTITIRGRNDAPVAANDSYSTLANTTLTVSAAGVLANDSDADQGAALTAVLVSGPAHGTLTLNSDGSLSYVPTANYDGPDSFTYKANDGSADSNVATVSITVVTVNHQPVAVNDSHSLAMNTNLVVASPGVLSNDSDADGDTLTVVAVNGVAASVGTLITLPSGAKLTLKADGSFTYVPKVNFAGTDSFAYTVGDHAGGTAVATVSLTIVQAKNIPSGWTATISYWAGSDGQDLIRKLGPTVSGVTLANWLATTFPHLYGKYAGANNLTGKTNADVASLFLKFYNTYVNGMRLDAQVLAVALAVYTTTDSLGGKTLMPGSQTYVADYYCWEHDARGLGGLTYNVGDKGAAFDVANNTTLTVHQYLVAGDRHAGSGVMYNNDAVLQSKANTVFKGINSKGNRAR